jgi:putative tricarboxylic transport membrane protein
VTTAFAPAPEGAEQARGAWLQGKSELGLSGLLVALGVFVLVETSRIEIPANANSIGPRFFPTVVGCVLCLVGTWLVVDVLRGGHGDMEAAEDIDLTRTSDWRTLGLLSAVFLGHVALLNTLGFAIAGSLLFFGVGAVLGSRHWARDAGVSIVLATAVYLLFGRVLGVGLPAGLLDGIL